MSDSKLLSNPFAVAWYQTPLKISHFSILPVSNVVMDMTHCKNEMSITTPYCCLPSRLVYRHGSLVLLTGDETILGLRTFWSSSALGWLFWGIGELHSSLITPFQTYFGYYLVLGAAERTTSDLFCGMNIKVGEIVFTRVYGAFHADGYAFQLFIWSPLPYSF